MADSGSVAFDVADGTARVTGHIFWEKTGGGASFYAIMEQAYSAADNHSKFRGNNLEKMRLGVDGSYTAWIAAAGARGAGVGASGSGWVGNNDYDNARTATITKAAKATAYALVIEASGNGTNSGSYAITIQFNLPIWINDGGTLKQIEKAYCNDNGTIKECAVYYNDDGTIKEIK